MFMVFKRGGMYNNAHATICRNISVTLMLQLISEQKMHRIRPGKLLNFPNWLAILLVFALLPTRGHAQNTNQTVNPPSNVPTGSRRPVNEPANPALPSLFLIGDSTVRNGQGNGADAQWGWGDLLAPYFDTSKINVVNRALGGTSSRTFYRDQWARVLARLKPGDFVIMQFGHNDGGAINDTNRARGTIKGVGDETQEIDNLITKKHEVVHSFGWYEKQIILEARTKGAMPVVCSLIPRNNWKEGAVIRNKNDYAGWAGQVRGPRTPHFSTSTRSSPACMTNWARKRSSRCLSSAPGRIQAGPGRRRMPPVLFPR